jgi:anthranilate synthase/aminodeoxychorismate synthase-like glutamine amidotransferase
LAVVLILDNYDSFTWNLVQALGTLDAGLDIRVVRNDRMTPAAAQGLKPSHLIVSPGPCTPAEAGVSGAIIQRLAGRVPILGVCLGHQCIAAAFGMTVSKHAVPVHGKASLIQHDGRGVLAGLESPFEAARYHSLVVEPATIPARGWTVSAWTDDAATGVRLVMGLRRDWGESGLAPLEGVQFHPESFLTPRGPALLANFLAMGTAPDAELPAPVPLHSGR